MMPLMKYYCDYCDKQFRDTPAARKYHLSSDQHERARKQWYDSVRDGGPFFLPDGSLAKGICHHFVRTGTCKYGTLCKYFHPVQTVVNQTPATSGLNSAGPGKFGGNQFIGGSTLSGDRTGVSWGNLPPSLRPPPEGGYPPLPFVDWG